MANRKAAVLALGLVASLGLNAYQVLRSPSAPARRESLPPKSPGATPRAPQPEPSTGPGAIGKVVVGELDGDGRSCDKILPECRQELSALEREATHFMRPRERFEMAVPDPDVEARFKPVLARLLAGHDYDLECRTGICRVDVVTRDGDDPADWMSTVQDDERLFAMAPSRSFEDGGPKAHPIMYLTPSDPDAVAAVDVFQPLIDALESSGAIEDCARQHPGDRGTLRYRLRILPDEREVIADYGGDLYATDAGRCIARAQTEILAGTEVPEKVSGRPLYHEVTLPRGPEPDSLTASAASPARPTQATRAIRSR